MNRKYETSRRYRPDWAMLSVTTNDYWEKVGGEYETFSVACEPCMYEHVFSILDDLISTTQPVRLIDIGCGTAVLSSRILQKWTNAKVTCVDFAESMLRIAQDRRAHQNISFQLADVENSPPSPGLCNLFDIAICVQVLMDIQNIKAAYRWIMSVLRTGGIAIITVTHPFMAYNEVANTPGVPSYDQVFPYEVCFNCDSDNGTTGFSVPNFNHPIGEYLQAAIETGLNIDSVQEITNHTGHESKGLPSYFLIILSRRDIIR